MPDILYTYQGGKRLKLSYSTGHFISRCTKKRLIHERFSPLQEISPHSWSVATSADRLQDDLARARDLAPAYPAYCIAATGARFLVTDRVFVRFRHDVNDGEARQLAALFDLTVIERLSPRDYLLRAPRAYDVVDVVRTMTERELATVELVDHDLNVRPHTQELSKSEGESARQWQLYSSVDHPLVRSSALLDCEGAWNANGYGDRRVVIAIIDAGCNLSDPNFGPDKFVNWAVLMDGRLRSRADFTSAARDEIMNPPQLHGTLCATLAAAGRDQTAGTGVAPGCSLLPVKWQDLAGTTTFPQSLFSRIVKFLRGKADVVSNSWNRGANGYWPPYIVDCLKDAALHGRRGKGMVWVWSAGNTNTPIRYRSKVRVPISVSSDGEAFVVNESSKYFRNSFAGLPGVLHVGAISSLGQRCHYSNYGYGLDLVAPSGNFHLYGRYDVSGLDVLAPLGRHSLHPFAGTSAAAPQVAGVAALVRSANPRLTSSEIVSLLRRTADRAELDMSPYQPSGRAADPDPAWDVSPVAPFQSGDFVNRRHPDGAWSPWFGFGKANARKAVEEALRRLHH